MGPGMAAQVCNPSYLGGGLWSDVSLGKKFSRPYLNFHPSHKGKHKWESQGQAGPAIK
jgi:hypothetical protein